MEQISNASRAFKCDQGETVTMTFAEHNTSMRVTYRFDDQDTAQVVEGNSFSFGVDQPFRILRVFFHFINESGTGGSYDVRLEGSNGGSFDDPPPVLQAGPFVPFRRYAFVH